MNNRDLSELNIMDIEGSSKTRKKDRAQKIPWIRLLLLILIIPINILSSLIHFLDFETPTGVSQAYVEGAFWGAVTAPITIPIIIVLLFQTAHSNRNWSSRIKIFFWVCLFFLFGGLYNIGSFILAAQT